MLIGLPGAGKTTFFKSYFAATHRHVSKDLWPNAAARDSRQRTFLDEALGRGESAVVDNTNPRAADRAPLIAIARAHGARVVGYFFDVTTRQAVARNAARTEREKRPKAAIFTTAKRLEAPSFAEGFDQLFRVTIADDRAMSVAEIKNP